MVIGVVLVSHYPGDTVESVRQQQAKQDALAAAAAAQSADSIMHLQGPSSGVPSSSSSSSSLGRRLAAMELSRKLWHVKAANGGVSGAAQQRRLGDSASSAIAAASSWPSLAAQDSGEQQPEVDALVHLQERV
jgi:hypothetical protein